MSLDTAKVLDLIRIAIKEDVPSVDVTCEALVPKDSISKGYVISKGDYVVSGLDIAKLCYNEINEDIKFETKFKDGDYLKKGTILFNVSGNTRDLLKAERTVLNIISHMMGIATKTKSFVDAVKGTKTVILDTRKTLPGLRYIQKLAVVHGGGTNHRASLSDAVLIKENHIACAGGIQNSVLMVKDINLKKEIEVRDMDELNMVLDSGSTIDVVMLDNMTPEQVKKAVALVNGRLKLEISGGINQDNIKSYADAGADFISIGALTHSVQSADLSFLFEGV